MPQADSGPAPASLPARVARECVTIAGQVFGVVLLLFLILESGAIADPAVRALGERPSMERLGSLRVEMGYFESFESRTGQLSLDGDPATVSFAGDGDTLVLESIQGQELARFATRGLTTTELAQALRASDALGSTRIDLVVDRDFAEWSALGWVTALRGSRLLVDTRRPASMPWAKARPAWSRFFTQTGELLRFEFGRSLDGQAVASELSRRAGRSLTLSVPGLLLGSLLALTLAAWSSRKPGSRLDRNLGHLSALVIAISSVSWVLLMRGWFAGELQWFPVSAWDPPSLTSLLLPLGIWIWIATWPDYQVYRKLFLEALRKPHVTAARARGLSERTIRRQHGFRLAAATIIAQFVLALPFLVLGSLLLEQTFVIPGLGEYVVQAARSGDTAVLRAVTLCVAVGYILSQRLGDWAAARLDPRWRQQLG